MLQQFTLTIQCSKGELYHDYDTFAKMDPYCIIHCGAKQHKTATCSGGGKHPKWVDFFTTAITTEDSLQVHCYDAESFSKDEDMGAGQVSLSQVKMMGSEMVVVDLFKKGVCTGKVWLELTCKSNTQVIYPGGMQTTMPTYPVQQTPMYPMQQTMPTYTPMMQQTPMMMQQQPMMMQQQPMMTQYPQTQTMGYGMQQTPMMTQMPMQMPMQQMPMMTQMPMQTTVPMGYGMQQPVYGQTMQQMPVVQEEIIFIPQNQY